VALPKLPPVVLELERKIMHALRDTINVGYQGVEEPFFETQKIIRGLLNDTSAMVKPLSGTVFESAKQVCCACYLDFS